VPLRLIAVALILLTGCAAQAPVEREEKPLEAFYPQAQSEAKEFRISDDHVYAGIALLEKLPTHREPKLVDDEGPIRQFRIDGVEPFSFSLVDVDPDDTVIGIHLYYVSRERADARAVYLAARKKMYQKYRVADNTAVGDEDIAIWHFLPEEKWVDYRAADLERRHNMAWLFANQKRLRSGIDEVLQRASIAFLEPTEKMPLYSVGINYESHKKRATESAERQKLEDSLDL